jgi:hypothetical protein
MRLNSRSGPADINAEKTIAKSVVMIYLQGGPSHLDLWDPKPAATDTVRGPFQTIDTSVPGIQVTDTICNPEALKRSRVHRSVPVVRAGWYSCSNQFPFVGC